MLPPTSIPWQKHTSKIIFYVTVAAGLFWVLSKSFNVYRWPVVSAIFEILWFPSLLILFVLPIVSLVHWYKQKFSFKSFYPYSILIAIAAILSTLIFR